MIILQVDIDGVVNVPRKRNPPVLRDGNRIALHHVPGQRIKAEARQIKVLGKSKAGCGCRR
jgi:hypothetical protein